MAHSTFELSIAARKHIGRCVIYHNIRIELKVLKRCAVKCGAGYLRDSENQSRVNLGFPPNGCHSAGYRCSHDVADLQGLICVR